MGESKGSRKKESGLSYRSITSYGLSSREASERFDRLQQKLIPLWKSISSINQEEQTIVVIPSMTIPDSSLGSMEQVYEERFLFLLFLLRHPNARLVYVTSAPVLPAIVDYYISLLPGMIPAQS